MILTAATSITIFANYTTTCAALLILTTTHYAKVTSTLSLKIVISIKLYPRLLCSSTFTTTGTIVQPTSMACY